MNRFEQAKKQYAAIGVDAEGAIERLREVPISVHCWQGDDVLGFDGPDSLSGGIQTTGNYPGRATGPEELMEDTFCDVIIKGVGFLGNASFKTYLFSVAKNKAFAEMRRRGKNCDIAAAESYGERYVEASFADSERSRIIARALGRLNRDHRTVIYLLYFENMSYKEIGRVMKKTEKQVNNLAYRAKRALREIFEKDGLTYEELI